MLAEYCHTPLTPLLVRVRIIPGIYSKPLVGIFSLTTI